MTEIVSVMAIVGIVAIVAIVYGKQVTSRIGRVEFSAGDTGGKPKAGKGSDSR